MSFEKVVKSEGTKSIENLDVSMLKFFWQINPFFKSRKNTSVSFLRKLKIFDNFSDIELWHLSKSLHKRDFDKGEVIFKENDSGVGFYFIQSGNIDICIEKNHSTTQEDTEVQSRVVVTLETNDYFGELALLQDKHSRNATAVAKTSCTLLGIFKPDLDRLIYERPVVASKLLQSVSLIVANRLYGVTQDLRVLKDKYNKIKKRI